MKRLRVPPAEQSIGKVRQDDYTSSVHKVLSSAVVLSTLKSELAWPSDAPQVSAKAADLYRSTFVLDCNTLASIGFQLTDTDQERKLKAVRESGRVAEKVLGANFKRVFSEIWTEV